MKNEFLVAVLFTFSIFLLGCTTSNESANPNALITLAESEHRVDIPVEVAENSANSPLQILFASPGSKFTIGDLEFFDLTKATAGWQ